MTWAGTAIAGAGVLGAGASIFGANKQSKAAQAAAQQQMAMYQQTAGNLQPWMQTGQTALNQLALGTGQSPSGLAGANVAGQSADQIRQSLIADYQRQRPGQMPDASALAAAVQKNLAAQQSYQGAMGSGMQQGSLLAPFTADKFHESPGYQWQLQQGQAAIDKGAAARGNLYAPQTLQDLGKYGQGLAQTDFNNAYQQYTQQQRQQYDMLAGLSGSGQNAAVGMGGFGSGAVNQAGNYQTGGAAAQAGGLMGATNALSGAGLGIAGYQQYLQGMQQGNYGSTPSYGMGYGAGQGLDPYGGGLGLTAGNGGSGLGLQLPAAYP
jgi:hypothetical protein